jgi:coatomer subunit alpha
VKADLREAYRAVQANKLSDAETAFRAILHTLLLVVITTDEEAKEVRHLVTLSGLYFHSFLAIFSGVVS